MKVRLQGDLVCREGAASRLYDQERGSCVGLDAGVQNRDEIRGLDKKTKKEESIIDV